MLIEPLFIQNGVDVVFSGHEHFYERLKPQKGIYYITQGGGAKLREGQHPRESPMTAKGFDTDNSFTLVEIVERSDVLRDDLARGQVVDSGSFMRREVTSPAAATQLRPPISARASAASTFGRMFSAPTCRWNSGPGHQTRRLRRRAAQQQRAARPVQRVGEILNRAQSGRVDRRHVAAAAASRPASTHRPAVETVVSLSVAPNRNGPWMRKMVT